jgi:hypothetical protein
MAFFLLTIKKEKMRTREKKYKGEGKKIILILSLVFFQAYCIPCEDLTAFIILYPV